jgi:hypothetical protein
VIPTLTGFRDVLERNAATLECLEVARLRVLVKAIVRFHPYCKLARKLLCLFPALGCVTESDSLREPGPACRSIHDPLGQLTV